MVQKLAVRSAVLASEATGARVGIGEIKVPSKDRLGLRDGLIVQGASEVAEVGGLRRGGDVDRELDFRTNDIDLVSFGGAVERQRRAGRRRGARHEDGEFAAGRLEHAPQRGIDGVGRRQGNGEQGQHGPDAEQRQSRDEAVARPKPGLRGDDQRDPAEGQRDDGPQEGAQAAVGQESERRGRERQGQEQRRDGVQIPREAVGRGVGERPLGVEEGGGVAGQVVVGGPRLGDGQFDLPALDGDDKAVGAEIGAGAPTAAKAGGYRIFRR